MSTLSDRREFIRTTAAAGVALAAMPSWLRSGAPGANGRVRIAVIGTNNRGLDHI